jgi:chemotaxis protein MotB
MSRKHREAEHDNNDRWMVSYADFVTLLFAFFVVLYASAEVDTRKMAELAAAIAGGFQELGVFANSGQNAAMGGKPAVVPKMSTLMASQMKNTGDANNGGLANVMRLKKELETALAAELKNNEVQLHMGPDGLVLSLREIGFFKAATPPCCPAPSRNWDASPEFSAKRATRSAWKAIPTTSPYTAQSTTPTGISPQHGRQKWCRS